MKKVLVCSKRSIKKDDNLKDFFTQLEYELGYATAKTEENCKIVVKSSEDDYEDSLEMVKYLLDKIKINEKFSLVKGVKGVYFCDKNVISKERRILE